MSHNVVEESRAGAQRRTRRAVILAATAAATAAGRLTGRLAHIDYTMGTPLGIRSITLPQVGVATAIFGLAGRCPDPWTASNAMP